LGPASAGLFYGADFLGRNRMRDALWERLQPRMLHPLCTRAVGNFATAGFFSTAPRARLLAMPIQTLTRLSDLAPERWDALLPDDQPFLRHAFLSTLEDSGSVGGQSGWYPAHRLLLDDQGHLRAAMPAYVKVHSYGEYVFDWSWADACQRAGIGYYPKLLGAVPFSPVGGARLLAVDASAASALLEGVTEALDAEDLSSLHVNFTDDFADAVLRGREHWLERLGCQYHWHNRGYRDFQDFLDAFASRKRKQVRKEREQVAGQGIEFQWREGHELLEADWDFVYACYANTYAVRGPASPSPRTGRRRRAGR